MPKPGETISTRGISHASGGKGANQAGAWGKLKANTVFLWQVGKDEIGDMVLSELNEHNVDTSKAKILHNEATGQAYILSMPNGENSIIIHGGANTAWESDLESLDPQFVETIKASKILLLQRELPEHVNTIAAKVAKDANVTVILDAGGHDIPITDSLLSSIDIFSPNETELERIMESDFDSNLSPIENGKALIEKYSNLKLLLKLGENGSVYISNSEVIEVPAVSDHKGNKIIDTTGAGDWFTGAFATKLAEGKSLKESMEYANVAGFLCITKFGALPSLPTKDEVDEFLK